MIILLASRSPLQLLVVVPYYNTNSQMITIDDNNSSGAMTSNHEISMVQSSGNPSNKVF